MTDFTWSYSSIGLFDQCPKKYYHLRVAKDVVEPETEHLTYGKMVHEAAEKYIKDGEPVPEKFSFIVPALDVLKAIPGRKHCEYKMGLTKELQPCNFFAKDVWFRGVADLVIINDKLAHIVDYKTGKSSEYADVKQLELMALCVFKHFPDVERVKAGLAFVVCEDFVKAQYVKEDASEKWLRWIQETDRLSSAYKNKVWNAKPNFTCRRHCPVKDCEHNGKGHYR
jgi:hypothetical protein